MTTSAQAEVTKSHIANTETEIIDTVELTGLKDNQKYYLKSVPMDNP